MAKFLVVHRISNDFNSWKKVFDSQVDKMKNAGCLNYSTGTIKGDSKNVYVMGEVDTVENFNKFFQSKETQETVKKSGVIGEPQVTIFDEKEQRDLVLSHTHH
jgi:hypothetical protein